jgi:hypothetical protein
MALTQGFGKRAAQNDAENNRRVQRQVEPRVERSRSNTGNVNVG